MRPEGLARTDELPKLFLGNHAGDAVANLTKAFDRSVVKTSDPVVRVTWRNREKAAVLEVTWPVRWAN